MAITFGDRLIDSGYYDITPEQEREIEAREECARRGLDPDDDAADGVAVWMVVDKEMRQHSDEHGHVWSGPEVALGSGLFPTCRRCGIDPSDDRADYKCAALSRT